MTISLVQSSQEKNILRERVAKLIAQPSGYIYFLLIIVFADVKANAEPQRGYGSVPVEYVVLDPQRSTTLEEIEDARSPVQQTLCARALR